MADTMLRIDELSVHPVQPLVLDDCGNFAVGRSALELFVSVIAPTEPYGENPYIFTCYAG